MTKEFFVQEIDAHSEMMYRVAFTILRNREACKDALQEAVLRAWEKRDTLRDEQLFRTWIMRILINVCCTMQRKSGRMISMEEIPEPSVGPPDPTFALVLRALPAKLRLPLMLCYMEGMSYEEAAAALRIPLTTLRSRLHRAKKTLRKELDAE